MDALRDIENHPACTYRVENGEMLKKKLKVLKILNKLKCHIARHRLTERTITNSNEFSHYKECYESVFNQPAGDRDTVDTCKCCYVGFCRYRALQILDEIHLMNHSLVDKNS